MAIHVSCLRASVLPTVCLCVACRASFRLQSRRRRSRRMPWRPGWTRGRHHLLNSFRGSSSVVRRLPSHAASSTQSPHRQGGSLRSSKQAAAMADTSTAEGDKPEVPEDFQLIQEGQAKMLLPKGNQVFYNKVQVMNRDLSILMLRLFAERRLRDRTEKQLKKAGLSKEDIQEKLAEIDWTEKVKENPEEDGMVVLDALAASGLRSIRYYKEVPGIKKVIVNDLDQAAVELAHRNVDFNGVDSARVTPQQGNANLVMYTGAHSTPATYYDVIDLDPYGSAAPFLGAAVQAVADGGMLCVTCTDMAVLNGNYPETCYGKYRGMPTKGRYMHEMAVRIVLAAIEQEANRARRYIQPLLSVAMDFYLRVFVRVFTSPAEVKKAVLKLSYVYQSLGCPSFYLQPVGRTNGSNFQGGIGPPCPEVCPETGTKYRLGGPMYSAPMHDMEWVLEALRRAEAEAGPTALASAERIVGLLTTVSEELHDVPLFYTLQDLAATLHCNSIPANQMQAALVNAGYRVSQQHKEPRAVKTDAPPNVIWDIMRCWVKRHPVGARGKKEESPAFKILSKEPELQADFAVPASLRRERRKVARFPPNPEAFWGPGTKAHGGRKRKRNGEAAEGVNADAVVEAGEEAAPPPSEAAAAVGASAAEDVEGVENGQEKVVEQKMDGT